MKNEEPRRFYDVAMSIVICKECSSVKDITLLFKSNVVEVVCSKIVEYNFR